MKTLLLVLILIVISPPSSIQAAGINIAQVIANTEILRKLSDDIHTIISNLSKDSITIRTTTRRHYAITKHDELTKLSENFNWLLRSQQPLLRDFKQFISDPTDDNLQKLRFQNNNISKSIETIFNELQQSEMFSEDYPALHDSFRRMLLGRSTTLHQLRYFDETKAGNLTNEERKVLQQLYSAYISLYEQLSISVSTLDTIIKREVEETK